MPIDSNTADDESVAELANALRPALLHLMRQLRRDSEDSGLGITALQNLLLALIHKHPGIGVSELARMEKLRAPTVSAHVSGLEQSGFVRRSAEEGGDRRRNGLYATEQGERVLQAMQTFRTDWLAGRLARLSPASRQRLADAVVVLRELAE